MRTEKLLIRKTSQVENNKQMNNLLHSFKNGEIKRKENIQNVTEEKIKITIKKEKIEENNLKYME